MLAVTIIPQEYENMGKVAMSGRCIKNGIVVGSVNRLSTERATLNSPFSTALQNTTRIDNNLILFGSGRCVS